jgi:hypothetical protein
LIPSCPLGTGVLTEYLAMRAAVLTCSLCLLTAAQAVAQEISTTQPPMTQPPATLPATPPPIPAQPTPPEAMLTDMTGAPGSSGLMSNAARSGRPFGMQGPCYYAAADYMLFWYTPMNCPTLMNTTPSVLVNDPSAVPATNFPSKTHVSYNGVSGVRVNLGANFAKTGIEFSGFYLGERVLQTSVANDGTPVFIGRPFLDVNNGTLTTLNISSPNQYSGGVNAVVTSQLWGMELNARRSWYTFMSDDSQLLAGIRYMDLQESVNAASFSQFPTGDSVAIQDSVRTHNSFYGAQIGFTTVYGGDRPGIGFVFTTKSGIGGVNQHVDLVGTNTINQSGAVTTEAGGLFVRDFNAGSFSRGKFAYLQDIDLKLTYNFTSNFQVSFGYTLFYLSSVVRAGDQVNLIINPNTIRFTNGGAPTTISSTPAFVWNASSFVVQGLTFGAKWQY